MKGKVAKKFLAVASAAVLVVSGVVGDYCTAYAAVAPTVDVGEGLTYLFQMLSSSLGSSVAKSSVPSLYLAVDAYSKTSDPAYMAQLREYYKDDALVRSEPIDTGFCNWLMGAIKDVFVSGGDYGTEGADIEYKVSVPVYGDATYMPEQTSFDFHYNSGASRLTFTVPADCYVLPYASVDGGKLTFVIGLMSSKSFTCSWYSYATKQTYERNSDIQSLDGRLMHYYRLYEGSSVSGTLDDYLSSLTIPYPISRVWYNPLVTTDVSILLDKALAVIQAQAIVKTPAITAPISVPADTAAMEENAKAVAAADNADALYKALAAAGIAIDIGIDVPDETDKPTDAEIPDDGSVSVGKSLSEILAAITGLADKVAAIPSDIAAFFTPDMTAVSESFDSLKDSLMLKFGGLLQLADVFNRSYKFDTVIPVIKIPVPDNETLRTIFDQKTELVILDLTPFASEFQNFRSLLTAMLYVAFAFWFLDEFDVKIHIG